MANAVVRMKQGERRVIFASILAPAGASISLTSVTLTIFDGRRNVCQDGSGNPLQGLQAARQDSIALQQPGAAYLFYPAGLGLPSGVYTLVFYDGAQAPDGMPQGRILAPSVRVRVLPDAS